MASTRISSVTIMYELGLRWSSMIDRSLISEMLDTFRFDEAEQLIEEPDPGLSAEIAKRRREAEDQAWMLHERIIELGSEQRQAELADLAAQASTRSLLGMLDEPARERAELYLREAERWLHRRHEINERRLNEARRALEGLDLELAKGLANRIDGRYLSEEEADRRDQLLLDISARAMEMESLERAAQEFIEEAEPQQKRPSWWRRLFGG